MKNNKINTDFCRQAIAEHVAKNPGCVYSQYINAENYNDYFEGPIPEELLNKKVVPEEFEKPAHNPRNWKRTVKEKVTPNNSNYHSKYLRIFNCDHNQYDDSLRAYVYDDGMNIVHIDICGE